MEYEITEHPEHDAVEIHILEWKPTHNSYYEALAKLEDFKEQTKFKYIITYSTDTKMQKLWKMFGFTDMGKDPTTGEFWAMLEVGNG